MRNYVKNKLRMYRAVRQVVQKYNSSWTGLVAFENAVNQFAQKVTELENLTYQKTKSLMGVTSKRDAHRIKTGELALQVANAIYAYASSIENDELKAKMHYTPSAMKYSPNMRFISAVEGILNKAKLMASDLVPFGIDQDKIDDLELAYLEMVEILNLPRQAVVSRKVIGEKIDNVITDLDTVLKDQLDRLIVLLKEDELDFVLTYEGARTIVNHPATRRKLNLDDGLEENNGELPEDHGDGSP